MRASEFDAESLSHLFARVVGGSKDYNETEKNTSIAKRTKDYFLERTRHNDWILLVVKLNGRIIGYIEGNVEKLTNLHSRWMVIDPEFQREGIGRQLKGELEEYGRIMELTCIFSHVKASNIPSIKLNEALGYTGNQVDGIITFNKPLIF